MLINTLLRYCIVLIVILLQWDIQNLVTDAITQPIFSSDDATTTQRSLQPIKPTHRRPLPNKKLVTDAITKPTVGSDDATTAKRLKRPAKFTRRPVTTKNMMTDAITQLTVRSGDTTTTQIPPRNGRNTTPTNEESTTEIAEFQTCDSGEMINPRTGNCSAVYCYSPLQLDVISRTCVEHIEPITPRMTFYIPLRVLSNAPLMYVKRFKDLKELMNLFFDRIAKTMKVCEHFWFMTVNINYHDFQTFRNVPSDHDAEVINQAMTVIINIDPTDTMGEPNTTHASILNGLYKQLSFTWSKTSEMEGRTLDDNETIEGFIDENGEAGEIVLRTVIDYKSDYWLQIPPTNAQNIDQRVHGVMRSVRIGMEFLRGQLVYTNRDVYGQRLIVCSQLFISASCSHTNRASDLDFMKCPTFLFDMEQLKINTRTNDGIEYIDIKGNKATLGFDQFKTYNTTHVRVCVDAMRPTNDTSTPVNGTSTPTNDVSTPTNDVSTPTNDDSRPTNDVSRSTNDVSRSTSDAISPTDDATRPSDDVFRMTNDGIISTISSRPSSMAAINNMDIVTNVMILALLVLYIFFV